MALPPAAGAAAPAMPFAGQPRGHGLRRPAPAPPGAALRLGPLFWPWEKVRSRTPSRPQYHRSCLQLNHV
ncbi:hypothetical protein PAHAL_9G188200 [Panicum hallii]|uniref:Uncharacterized protein n=1 Tax=Panicum hallii TaxID=206008 RepID=A0A2S3IKJ6_9POAL|nr:hypothetical protein PAHAL_9G188200 [Panicum hallii]